MSEQHLLYLPQFQSIVCRVCNYALRKDSIRRHFERYHKDIPLKQRRELEDYVKDFDIREIKEIQNPWTEVPEVIGLKVHEGFMCMFEGCHHLRTTLMSIQKHCQREHGWTKSQGIHHVDTN